MGSSTVTFFPPYNSNFSDKLKSLSMTDVSVKGFVVEQDETRTKRKDRKRGIYFFIIGPHSQRAGEEGPRTCSSPPLPLYLPKQLEFQA